jgi:hypothetical protein
LLSQWGYAKPHGTVSVMVFGEDVDSNGVSVVLNPRAGVFDPPNT